MPESNLEEIVDGELLTMPPATKHHNAVLGLLHRIFIRYMRDSFDLHREGDSSSNANPSATGFRTLLSSIGLRGETTCGSHPTLIRT